MTVPGGPGVRERPGDAPVKAAGGTEVDESGREGEAQEAVREGGPLL